MDYTIWFGPVSIDQVRNACIPGSTLKVVQVTNKATAQPLLDKWRNSEGSYVPGLLQDLGITLGSEDALFVGSFSAGHNIVKQITKSPLDRSFIRGLVLVDSEQSAWADEATRTAAIPLGYKAFAQDAIVDPNKLFVASSGNTTGPGFAQSTDTINTMWAALESEGYRASNGSQWVPPGFSPPPVSVRSFNNFITLEYLNTISHEDHVRKLAAPLWQQVVSPWYAAHPVTPGNIAVVTPGGYVLPLPDPAEPGSPPTFPTVIPGQAPVSTASSSSDVTPWLLLAGGAVVAYLLLTDRPRKSRF